MASLNKVQIIGNAGRDCELRYSANGTAQGQFSVAVNNRRKNGDQWEDNTEWFNVVVFGDTAERLSQYIVKGCQVYVEGRQQTRTWDDKESGQKHYRWELIANNIQLLDRRADGDGERTRQSQPHADDLPFD